MTDLETYNMHCSLDNLNIQLADMHGDLHDALVYEDYEYAKAVRIAIHEMYDIISATKSKLKSWKTNEKTIRI